MAEMLLTLNDVVERLQLSRATIYRLINQGKLRPMKIGKALRFREKDIDGFIARGDAENGRGEEEPRRSSPRALLKVAGTWVGNDLDECLQAVYDTRGETRF